MLNLFQHPKIDETLKKVTNDRFEKLTDNEISHFVRNEKWHGHYGGFGAAKPPRTPHPTNEKLSP